MRIGLIAGSGQFPIIFCKAAKLRGFFIYAVAYRDEADSMLAAYVDAIEWIYLGQVKRLITFFRKHHVHETVMLGGIQKTKMFSNVRPDTKAISLIVKLKHTHDDGLLRAFADLLEKEGIKIRPSTFLLPDLLAKKGCWTRRKPNRHEKADMELGWKMAKEIGRLDIGQCVVVGGGSVLAVEAIDGTDATIKRGGTLGKENVVVVKVCKPNQDIRFDMPAVGIQTVEVMRESGASVLVIEAGKAIVFDREEMVALANQYSISIVAMDQAGNE